MDILADLFGDVGRNGAVRDLQAAAVRLGAALNGPIAEAGRQAAEGGPDGNDGGHGAGIVGAAEQEGLPLVVAEPPAIGEADRLVRALEAVAIRLTRAVHGAAVDEVAPADALNEGGGVDRMEEDEAMTTDAQVIEHGDVEVGGGNVAVTGNFNQLALL